MAIFGLSGQRVNAVKLNQDEQLLIIHCDRDKRKKAIDPVTSRRGAINRYVRRQVRNLPLFGYPSMVEIELAQLFISRNEWRIETVNL